MSLFTSILDKLGFNRPAPLPATPRTAAEPPAPTTARVISAQVAPTARPAQPVAAVDVMGKLEGLAAANPQKLNWKTSIVDLLKLLGLDSSLAARKELATELGCPAEKMGDSAQMNMWLHKTVLQKLAQNGGNIPPELLH
jgi:hypothetical protein